jgi:hypothetical protein
VAFVGRAVLFHSAAAERTDRRELSAASLSRRTVTDMDSETVEHDAFPASGHVADELTKMVVIEYIATGTRTVTARYRVPANFTATDLAERFPGSLDEYDSDVMYDWEDRDGQEEWLPSEFGAADDDGD